MTSDSLDLQILHFGAFRNPGISKMRPSIWDPEIWILGSEVLDLGSGVLDPGSWDPEGLRS